MKRLVVIAIAALALIMVIPLFALILIIGSANSVAACQAWADTQPVTGTPVGEVTISQANIKTSLAPAVFRSDLDKTLAAQPDLVSLNEVAGRSDAALSSPGYAAQRGQLFPNPGQSGSTAVLWRTDKWTKVDGGRVLMVPTGPQKWDKGRAATWVTVQNTQGSKISMISVHHMINPARFGPDKPLRQQLYRQGLQVVTDLVETLAASGPVFVAGDLNYQYSDNAPWGPKAVLGSVGMKPSMGTLGTAPTHDGGGIIDYLFFQTASAVPLTQSTANLASDHQLLTATFSLLGTETPNPADPVDPAGTAGDVADDSVQAVAGLTPAQTERAAAVVAAGQQASIPAKGIVIALAVASQESGFRVLANDGQGGDLAPDQTGIQRSLELPHDGVGTDHGSLGVMQQQWPSWGSMEQLMDSTTSAGLFYSALLQVPGWEDMPVTEAAQTVQRSAYPDAYADDEVLAQQIYDALADGTADVETVVLTADEQAECAELLDINVGATTCPPTSSPAEEGLTPDGLLVLRCVDQQFGPHTYGGVGERATNPNSDHPSGRAVDVMIENYALGIGIDEGTQIAEWVRAHATELGVKYVIWRAKIWNVGDPDWSTYTHPSGATDDSSLHMDHVHVSVNGNSGTGFPPTTGGGAVVYPVPAAMVDTNRDNWGNTGSHWRSWHTGTDFSVGCGTPVLASHSGTVQLDHSQSWAGPTLVKISVGPGQLTTWYAHMHTTNVNDGDAVVAGQKIGQAGEEGNTEGCHLHFEVHLQGGSIYGPDNTDPTLWLAANARRTPKRVSNPVNGRARAVSGCSGLQVNRFGRAGFVPPPLRRRV